MLWTRVIDSFRLSSAIDKSAVKLDRQIRNGQVFGISLSDASEREDGCRQVQEEPAIARGSLMPKKQVLVVEDADATRRLIEVSLTIDGFDVIQRIDGASGLEAARALHPDLIVLDIALPEMDGWEVLAQLRSDPAIKDIPVVVVTAHDTAESRSKADFATADAFVGKPFDLHKLRAVISDLIEKSSRAAPAL